MAEQKTLNYKQIAQLEYDRCSKSPEYFITKYVYIQMTNGGRGKFILYEFQKKLLHLLHTRDRLIILKSRQLGITTLSSAYALWLMVFRKDQSILALAPDQDKARGILDKIHFAYDELPNWLLTLAGAQASEKAKLRITLDNGSKAVAASGASKSARGKTATFLVLDEVAFIDDAEELWGSAQQTLSTGGSAILLSTPNGASGLFYELYSKAEQGEGEFIPVKLKWDVHPDRDQAWRDRQETELGKRMASQECDTNFLSSGDTYLGAELLEHIRTTLEEPAGMEGFNKSYWRWKYPNQVGNCMVIVDTARGDSEDSSGIQVIDLETGDQIAELKEVMPPKELAKVAVAIARDYNNALLIIENTGIGGTTCSYARDEDYPNIFYSPRGDTADMHMYLEKITEYDEDKMVIGYTNSTKTRPLMLNKMRESITDKVMRIKSKRLLHELTNFIWKNGKPQAAQGFHDDLVMPYAIGAHLRDIALNYKTQGLEMQRATMNGIRRNQMNYTYRDQSFNTNPYDFVNPITGEIEDISWVNTR